MKKTLLSLVCFFVYIFSIKAQALYGTTNAGGIDGGGTINKFMPATNSLLVAKSFESIAAYPGFTNFVQASDGKLYGTTNSGGSSGAGVIFSFNPSTSTYTKLKDFDYNNGDGAIPYGSMMQASDGKLYGMTAYGGSGGYGVVYSFDLSSSTYTKLKDFDFINGANPYGSLIQASNGKLYGMTANGGNNSIDEFTFNVGVIFSFDPSTSTYTKLKDFDNTNGGSPFGSLIQASDGRLYGMTGSGGSSGAGVIFSFDPSSSTYQNLKEFDYINGGNPNGSLMQASDGELYGMTNYGGSSDVGVIFSFDLSSFSYKKVKEFDYANGAYPFGRLMQANDGKLYGMTSRGGSNGVGIIFSFVPSSSTFTNLKDFDGANGGDPLGSLRQASDGKLYGMTSSGGSSGAGVIFSFDPSASIYKNLKDFGINQSGSYVSASLIQESGGKLYGITSRGGGNGVGVIFSFDPSSSTYTKLKDFDNINGGYPLGALMQASDGKLYGMTVLGGSSGNGVIFSFDPSSSTYTKLKDFDHTDGAGPYGSLMQARDGKLYGMTPFGGSSDVGVIFSFDPSTLTYTKLKDFDYYTNGGYPLGSLMQASNGKLYGTTEAGGASGVGVIFSFDPSSFTYTKLKDYNNADGANPVGKLVEASDGKLYGMTFSSGGYGSGVIFSFDRSSSIYTNLKDFDNTNGANPQGSLMQASDGKLYGMTNSGGSSGVGVIFSFDPSSATYTKLKDYNGVNGANPYIGSAFIEVNKSSKALLSIDDAVVYEATRSVTLTVTLSKKTPQAVSVKYKTVDGTARSKANKPNQADYTAKSGTVTIPAGSQTAMISIILIADNLPEFSEQFYVELGKPVNAGISKSTGTVTILDGSPLSTRNVQQVVNEKQQIYPGFILKASPNPSSSQFTLKIVSDNTKGMLSLHVADVLGRVIEVKNNIFAGQTLQIGNNYKPGVYFVEVTEGNNKKQLKLIKLVD